MAHDIGYVDNGSEGMAHWQMLLKLKTVAEANGWTTLRYTNPTDGSNRELILQGVGLSGAEAIFIGFRAYHSATSDYYNMSVAGFTGYVSGNTFEAQPGYYESGICAHNQRIDYWLAVNAQRIALALKVGSPAVYEVGYVGKYLPYATPGQYPYPLAVCGTLDATSGLPATRYSDATGAHTCGVKGAAPPAALAQGVLRNVQGVWQPFGCLPYTADDSNAADIRRDTGGYYNAMECELFDDSNVWGVLDGVRYISGFNAASEDTCMISSNNNVMFGDAFRTGIGDYLLLEMA